MEDQPEQRGRLISNDLNRDLMNAYLALPVTLDAMLEGKDGPLDVPPEQAAEAMEKTFWIMLRYVQTLATEVDRLRFTTGLDKESGPFGPTQETDSH
jgi:hypothetical protein